MIINIMLWMKIINHIETYNSKECISKHVPYFSGFSYESPPKCYGLSALH